MWNYRVERWPRTSPLFSSLTSGNWKFERIRLWREVTTSSTTIIHLLDSGSSWILCKLAAISHIYWEERISVWSFHRKRLVFKCCPSFLLTFRNFSFFFFTGHGDKSSNYHLCAKNPSTSPTEIETNGIFIKLPALEFLILISRGYLFFDFSLSLSLFFEITQCRG